MILTILSLIGHQKQRDSLCQNREKMVFLVIKVKYILWFYKLYSRTLSRPEDPLRVEELEPNIFND